jgi:lysophospholipase L1-like esterase
MGTALAAAPIAAVAYAVQQSQRLPDVTPRRFVDDRLRRPDATVVVGLGSSLVHGRVGASFVDLLSRRMASDGYQFVNAGVNGDLAYNARCRVEDVIACDPDVVFVLIGSNDVMASLGMRRMIGYRLFKRLPRRPSLEWFRDNVRAIAETLSSRTKARVAFCSLPTLGERLDSEVHGLVQVYNRVIRDEAARVGAAYVPVHEALDAQLQRSGHADGPMFGAAMTRMLAAVVAHYARGRQWNDIAADHGYELFVDGIHVSERGAAVIAGVIERFLRDDVGAIRSRVRAVR